MAVPSMPNDGFADVIRTVDTPLALAALSLLVVGTVLYGNTKNPNPALIRYGFLLAGVFGVLAIAGYIWQAQSESIRIARGSVFTDRDRPLEGAIVDLNGAGRTATLEDGSFRIPIERQDERASYIVEISKAGYRSLRQEAVPGPIPESRKYVLQRSVIDAGSITLARQIGIGVYAGAPEVMLEFAVDNTTDMDEPGTAALSLVSPSGRMLRLYAAWRGVNGTRMPLSSSLLSFPRLQRDTYFVGWNDGLQLMNTVQGVTTALNKSPSNVCIAGARMSAETIDDLRDVFNENFLWEPGDWSGTLTVSLRQSAVEVPLRFSLDPSSVEALRNVREVMRNCRGVILGSHEVSSGSARSPLFVGLR